MSFASFPNSFSSLQTGWEGVSVQDLLLFSQKAAMKSSYVMLFHVSIASAKLLPKI